VIRESSSATGVESFWFRLAWLHYDVWNCHADQSAWRWCAAFVVKPFRLRQMDISEYGNRFACSAFFGLWTLLIIALTRFASGGLAPIGNLDY
jgi:hypothetical protein